MNTKRFFLLILLLNGCIDDAPRDNPLDPESDSYVADGTLNGRIMIANQSSGLSGVTVWNVTDAVAVTTDSAGFFTVRGLSAGTHQFITSKQNYTNDTFFVPIKAGAVSVISRSVNGAPIVTFQQIVTRKIDQYFPSPQYFVEIAATVTDPNGINELDSVWFGVDSLRYPLSYSVTTKNFHATIYKYDFPTNSIQWLVGKQLKIISRDVNNAVNISSPFFVTRVIENEAAPIYPSSVNNDTVKVDSLYFRWSPPSVTFNYTYNISLSRVDAGTQTVIWTLSGLNSFNEEFFYYSLLNRPVLIAGNYVWTISMVDDFGNYGRSKESAFVIK